MRNRLQRLRPTDETARPAEGAALLRLGIIFVVVAGLLGLIAARVLWLQTVGRDRYVALWNRVSERIEPIPARDGRILTADGLVLACDEPQFAVTVHYRWLEDPPDQGWLTAQALARLAPSQRRDRARLAAAQEEVLALRRRMHHDLAAVLEVSEEALAARCRTIQQRVERIRAAVAARQQSSRIEEPAASTVSDTTAPRRNERVDWNWRTFAEQVWRELTTPPERPVRDPLIVAEELDYHPVAENVSLEAAGRIESFPSRFPGVRVQSLTRRSYPQGSLAAHLVGVRTPLHEDQYAARRERLAQGDPFGYRPGDAIGRSGVELAYDRWLHGVPGERRVAFNRRGEIEREEVLRPAVNGGDVVLSIDAGLQRLAESLLDAAVERGEFPPRRDRTPTTDGAPDESPRPVGGTLIALDVRTGRVLAAAAAPRQDARLLTAATPEEWNAAAADPRRPFFPRVTQAMLPPGSVFKIVTAVAGIEAGVLDPDERLDCRGYLHTPDRDRCLIYRHFGVGHGPVRLDEALSQSCNVYFYEIAQRLGPLSLAAWARRFGLGAPTGCDLPQERSGQAPNPASLAASGERWHPGMTRQLAVGQGALTVTPLQVARLMAAIANDGWLVTPHFVMQTGDASPQSPEVRGREIQLVSHTRETDGSIPPPQRVAELSPGTLAHIRRALLLTVEDPRGTGREARLEEVRVAGKTGTAEIGGGRPDHAWFAGYAPADSPRLAIVVVLEEGGAGGRAAAPIAREFLREAVRRGLLPRGSPEGGEGNPGGGEGNLEGKSGGKRGDFGTRELRSIGERSPFIP